MTHTPIRSRYDVFRSLASELNLHGKACEIGVFLGEFAVSNLQSWAGEKYYLVDSWCYRPPEHNKKTTWALEDINDDNQHQDKNYRTMLGNISPYMDRVVIKRGFSVEVAKTMDPDFFDIIYIDALHSFDACTDDLHAWYPKLKSGGLMVGDDYADHTDTDFGDVPFKFGWGVRSAVTKFCKERNIQHFVTYANREYYFPCWYFIKP